SSTSRVFPTPGSPRTTTTRPPPPCAVAMCPPSSSRSATRPTKGRSVGPTTAIWERNVVSARIGSSAGRAIANPFPLPAREASVVRGGGGSPPVLRLAALGSVVVVLGASPVRATTARDLCGDPVPDPCRIMSYRAVEPGSVLDFRPGALVLASNGILDAGSGEMGIVAHDVTLGAGARLVAAGGRITVLAEDRISGDPAARIGGSATGGGGGMRLVPPGCG